MLPKNPISQYETPRDNSPRQCLPMKDLLNIAFLRGAPIQALLLSLPIGRVHGHEVYPESLISVNHPSDFENWHWGAFSDCIPSAVLALT